MAEQKSNWAMATPGALYMVGAACFGVFALLTGQAAPTSIPLLGVWLVAVGVPIVVIGVVEYARGDILLGSINAVFGALVAVGGGLTFLATIWVMANFPPEAAPDASLSGWVWVAIGILFLLFLPAVGKVAWSLFIMFIELAVGILLLATGLITQVPIATGVFVPAGILFLIFGLYVMYAGTVFIVNTVYAKPKLSLGGPMFK